MLTDQSDATEEATEEVDIPDDGDNLYDIPADLLDDDTEAPAPEKPADPKGPPAKDEEATQPRDESGRFAEKEKERVGDPATDEAQPAEPPQAGEPQTTEAAVDESEPEMEFSFRADGQAIPIKGSRITKDSVIIPREYMPDVQRLMSHGVVYQGSFKQRLYEAKLEVEQTKAQVNEDVERSKAFLNFFSDLLDREEKGEPAIETWLDDFRQNRVKLEADATLAAAKAMRERQVQQPRLEGFDEPAQPAGQVSPEEDERFHNELSSELGNRVVSQMQAQQIRGLTPAELTRIQNAMTEPDEIDRYFKVALEDIPEYGIRQGQIIALDAQIAKTVKYQASLILDARRATAELKAAEQKNRANAGNLIPPTTPVAGVGTPKAKPKVPAFKNKKEMDEWMDSVDPLADI